MNDKTNNSHIIIYQNEQGEAKMDVIISFGYRVKSIQATRFLQWATKKNIEKQVKK